MKLGQFLLGFFTLTSTLIGAIRPPNDDCTYAFLAKPETSQIGDTTDATQDFSGALWEACGSPYSNGLVWYMVNGNGRKLRASTCSPKTQTDTTIHVFRNSVCGAKIPATRGVLSVVNPHCVGSNEDAGPACPHGEQQSIVEFCTDRDQIYLIAVGSWESGKFELTVTDEGNCAYPARNVKCSTAALIPHGETATVNLADATQPSSAWVGICGVNLESRLSGPGVWYKFVGTGLMTTIEEVWKSPDALGFTFRVWNLDSGDGCELLDSKDKQVDKQPPQCVTGWHSGDKSVDKWFFAEEGVTYGVFVEGILGTRGSVEFRVATDRSRCETDGGEVTKINLRFGGIMDPSKQNCNKTN